MSKMSKLLFFFVSLIFFVMFDMYYSNVIMSNIENLPQNPVFDLIFVQNTGAAFSILENSKVFLITFSVCAILGIIYYLVKHINKASGLAIFWTSLLVSGIFCNMWERITFGFVRDFFKLNFVNFPVFNISDVFINISVFAIVIIIVKYNFANKNNETSN